MKKISSTLLMVLFAVSTLPAQDLFSGFGSKGHYNKISQESDIVTIPQLSVSFDKFVETKVVVSEGKLSKLQNTFEAASKGGSYGGEAKSSAQTITILDTDMQLADFQELANDFQLILEEEISKAGIKVLPLQDFVKTEGFQKMSEKYSDKTANKGKKNSDEDTKSKVRMFPENGVFMFDENSLAKGGVPFIGMVRNIQKETGAVMLLQNIDINFATVELDASMEASTKRKVTTAETKVIPKMNISRNTFDFVGKNGPGASAELIVEYLADKEFDAKIYQDPEKGRSLFGQIFGVGIPTIEFDPFIVEMDKETYKSAARDLFRKYAQDFARTYASVGKK
ncbi:hypothetical protein Aoki45_03380 [Algoriphagus sp. oki45]|uniref:hypothetical protein n=1 Tax=Algoriphagus sp. oki45 TaxID=3067294 RepID=UPI0027F22861|nr:hypothetical protein Aoki45_03380 [Algoriphagus sp. oki45]